MNAGPVLLVSVIIFFVLVISTEYKCRRWIFIALIIACTVCTAVGFFSLAKGIYFGRPKDAETLLQPGRNYFVLYAKRDGPLENPWGTALIDIPQNEKDTVFYTTYLSTRAGLCVDKKGLYRCVLEKGKKVLVPEPEIPITQ